MRTLTWEGFEFGDFILIASIHLWNQSIENFMSSSPLGCDFVTSLVFTMQHDYLILKCSGSSNIEKLYYTSTEF